MTRLEKRILPYVRAKHPETVSVLCPMGNGFDTWCRAYTDPLKKGFYVVYLWEVLPRNVWPDFNLTSAFPS